MLKPKINPLPEFIPSLIALNLYFTCKMDKAATKSVDDHVSAMEHENVDVEYVKQQGYMGDHVTKQGRISPVERTLFWKAACLIGALAALMYFVAYLVSLCGILS